MHVWIVEMWTGKRWDATVGCRLTTEDGKIELCIWKQKCLDDKFRLRKYIRADK